MSDNIFIQRLWRTVKYEEDYLKDYKDVLETVSNLKSYFAFTITNACSKPWAIRRRRRSTLGKQCKALEKGPKGGCCRPTVLGIVVPRRSWRDIFCGKLGIGTKKEKSSKKERNGGPVGTDAADGNPLTTRIPTAAWKAQNAFHSSHKARRRFHNTNQIQQQKKGTFLTR